MRIVPEGYGPLVGMGVSIMALALTVAACQPASQTEMPDATPVQSNSKLIWTSPEGCKVYRLVDQYNEYESSYVHATICPSGSSAVAGSDLATAY